MKQFKVKTRFKRLSEDLKEYKIGAVIELNDKDAELLKNYIAPLNVDDIEVTDVKVVEATDEPEKKPVPMAKKPDNKKSPVAKKGFLKRK